MLIFWFSKLLLVLEKEFFLQGKIKSKTAIFFFCTYCLASVCVKMFFPYCFSPPTPTHPTSLNSHVTSLEWYLAFPPTSPQDQVHLSPCFPVKALTALLKQMHALLPHS